MTIPQRIRHLAGHLAPQEGRTLMELLVASAIAAITTLALASIIILGMRFSRSSQFEDQRVYPVRNAFDMIVRDLRVATGYNANCNGLFAISRQLDNGSIGIIAYVHDTASRQLVRRTYSTLSCTGTADQTQTIGYQITDFRIQYLSTNRFRVEMRAESNDPDQTEFVLQQDVTGRVLAQP